MQLQNQQQDNHIKVLENDVSTYEHVMRTMMIKMKRDTGGNDDDDDDEDVDDE